MRQFITLGCLIAAVLFFAVGSMTGMAVAFGGAAMFDMAYRLRARQQARALVPVRIRPRR